MFYTDGKQLPNMFLQISIALSGDVLDSSIASVIFDAVFLMAPISLKVRSKSMLNPATIWSIITSGI